MECANCGGSREGSFCSLCGQNDRNYLRAMVPMVWELLKETFELDSRLLVTLQSLLFRPGHLSREFSRNRRASYVTPIRLYLFASITFFFLLSVETDISDGPTEIQLDDEEVVTVEEVDLSRLMDVLPEEQAIKLNEIVASSSRPIAKQLVLQLGAETGKSTEPIDGVGAFLLTQAIDVLYEPIQVFEQAVDNLPVAMFFLLPVFALVLNLLYIGRNRYYVEHLVFAVHVHTFVFILFSIFLLMPDFTAGSVMNEVVDWTSTFLTIGMFAYCYLALKRYYEDGHFLTTAKFAFLLAAYGVMLTPGLLMVMFLTIVLL